MHTPLRSLGNTLLVLAAVMSPSAATIAQSAVDEPADRGVRTEVWLALTSWPSLSDLQPVVGGSFNSVGYGLGAAAYWPWKSTRGADWLFGIEGAVMATESDIPVFLDELLARDAYIAATVRWRLGSARNLSLDAGLAYHLLDIAQLETDYNTFAEFESWEQSAAGVFLGLTWDLGGHKEGHDRGLTLGLRAHFIDFGIVHDEDVLASAILGRDAGKLDGPLLILQAGSRWR